MVTYFRQLRADGRSMAETVRIGAERRLRPVLMTASITAFGLVPLLFASGPGSEIQRPLAIVVIGGLITSTLLTLIRSEEHTSELQSLMRISYAVLCLEKKKPHRH